jgi:hypothetical protein
MSAAAAQARRTCVGHVPRSIEFELLVLEVLHLHALGASELGMPPAPACPASTEPEAEVGEATASVGGRTRWKRAS